MTREDTIKVLAVLKAAYPASYRNMSRDEANGTVMIWATQFANDPVQVIMMAVQKLIATSTFPPTISEVKSKIRDLYWESWMALQQHENGFLPLENRQLEAIREIEAACKKYNDSGSNEPKLSELLGGLQNYLTDRKD